MENYKPFTQVSSQGAKDFNIFQISEIFDEISKKDPLPIDWVGKTDGHIKPLALYDHVFEGSCFEGKFDRSNFDIENKHQ